MNVLIDIAHPAHVHLFRNLYFILKSKKHNVFITVKKVPSIISLLDKYKIPYTVFESKRDSLFGKAIFQLLYNFKLLKFVLKHKINIGFSSSITMTHVSLFSKMHSIFLDDDDDEVEPLVVKYGHPFADSILSPDCLKRKSNKVIYYKGYHELAYLHPNRFSPDKNVLKEIGINEDDVFFILRFNAFKAHHDKGIKGISLENKRRLIHFLEKYGKVFITAERNIEEEFKKYQLTLSPDKVHSLIYYAKMLIGDSQTMTSEAAVLGTPSIRCNSFVGRISYLEEEEKKYQLTFGFLPSNFDAMFKKIEELIRTPNLKEMWNERKMKMLQDKIDVSSFFVWFIENYPHSKDVICSNSEYQSNFK